jgi:hypothetical protein
MLLGLALWILGFALGMMLFPFVDPKYIGVPILAILFPATLSILYWRFRDGSTTVSSASLIGLTWLFIAAAFDYVFLVLAFDVQGYYDPDLFVYYALLTLLSPPGVAWFVKRQGKRRHGAASSTGLAPRRGP